ncbi:MAG: hypothetical protein AABW45_01935 [Nanoarchaeota archaeon]
MGKTSEISFKLIILILLQYFLDLLYISIYPSVNPLRATLIGISAFALLSVQYFAHYRYINPVIGGLSIFSSALFGALLVQENYLVSKSFLSGSVHALILIITYLILIYLEKEYKKYKTTLT